MTPDPADPAARALIDARAGLTMQLTALGHALRRLEQARARLPVVATDGQWRGIAHAAYLASVGDLARQLDDAIAAVTLARTCTHRAIATMAARVG